AGTNIEGATIYSALLPCMECAKLIVASGIKRVVYTEEYIDKRFNETSRDFLNINGVKVDKV
ncbi:MAG TPA: dCMP deaminase, partial [candidate division WOR-3 bacterium]|nr:dCMP deaminase [candidate division WOR-3 bacterium]